MLSQKKARKRLEILTLPKKVKKTKRMKTTNTENKEEPTYVQQESSRRKLNNGAQQIQQ